MSDYPKSPFLFDRERRAGTLGEQKKSLLDNVETRDDGIPVLRDIVRAGSPSREPPQPAPSQTKPVAPAEQPARAASPRPADADNSPYAVQDSLLNSLFGGAPVPPPARKPVAEEPPRRERAAPGPEHESRRAVSDDEFDQALAELEAQTKDDALFSALLGDADSTIASAMRGAPAPKAPARAEPPRTTRAEPVPEAEIEPSAPAAALDETLQHELSQRILDVIDSTVAQVLPEIVEQAAREVAESIQAQINLVLPEIVEDLLRSDARRRH